MVPVGEKIVTSGMDKIFPRDIPIGTVVEVKPGNPFKQIRVQPAAKLDRLETVIVLLTQAPVEFKNEAQVSQNRARAGSSGGEAMNETYELRSGETHIEVHKFYPGAVLLAAVVALVFQATGPVYFPKLSILDLPMLVTIYFGLSRRNPSTGLLLGMVIGLAQDALSGPTVPLGFYGIAKTVIGYLASSIGARLDTEHPAARFALIFSFFVVHQGIMALIRRLLQSRTGGLA